MRSQNLSNLQFPLQLPMFVNTKQLMDQAPLLDQHDDETRADLMSNKLTEAMYPVEDVDDVHGAGVYDSMAIQGMRDPIELDLRTGTWDDEHGPTNLAVANGHHRLAVADALGHQEVPVTISETRTPPPSGDQSLGAHHARWDAIHAHPGLNEATAALEAGWKPRAVVPDDPRPYREVPSKFRNQRDSGDRWTWI